MSVRCVWDISLIFGCISSKLEAAGVIIIIIINIIIILSHVSVMFLHQSAWPWSELWLSSIRSTVFVLSLTAWWMALVETSELQLQLLLARQGNVMQCFGSSVVQVKFRWSDVILFRGSQQVCNDSHLCWRCKCFRTFYRGWIKPFTSSPPPLLRLVSLMSSNLNSVWTDHWFTHQGQFTRHEEYRSAWKQGSVFCGDEVTVDFGVS